MNADLFVQNHSDDLVSYIDSFNELIIYGFKSLLSTGVKYNHSDIKSKFKKRGRKRIALEDYLRNDFVNSYLKQDRKHFGLDEFIIGLEISEILDNIENGSLDIKLISPKLCDNNQYYIVECKILSALKKRKDYYVNDGIMRFSSSQYYPEANMNEAGMMAFVINESSVIEEIVSYINDSLSSHSQIETIKMLAKHQRLISATNYEYIYESEHGRDGRKNIKLTHIMLDYRSVYLP